ncbi:hypothetical protein GCM10023238_32240 [Streptomyces heliomycini]
MTAERVREHVALVNQEHHVFVGSLRDNLRLARTQAEDADLWAALGAVDADGWARALDEGLDTEVGSGGVALTPAQAQQIALARLVLADPHTLVLGRGDLAARPARGTAPGTLPGPGPGRQDRRRHRPPSAHRPMTRTSSPSWRRPHQRAGQPRRPGRGGRGLRGAVALVARLSAPPRRGRARGRGPLGSAGVASGRPGNPAARTCGTVPYPWPAAGSGRPTPSAAAGRGTRPAPTAVPVRVFRPGDDSGPWTGAPGEGAGRGGVRIPGARPAGGVPLRGGELRWKAGVRHRLGDARARRTGHGRRQCPVQRRPAAVHGEKGPVPTPWRYL